jgi:hypothetical protein
MGPKQVIVCPAFLAVVPDSSITVEIVDRSRIGITLVEFLDFFRYADVRQRMFRMFAGCHAQLILAG